MNVDFIAILHVYESGVAFLGNSDDMVMANEIFMDCIVCDARSYVHTASHVCREIFSSYIASNPLFVDDNDGEASCRRDATVWIVIMLSLLLSSSIVLVKVMGSIKVPDVFHDLLESFSGKIGGSV